MGDILPEISRNRQVKDYLETHFGEEPEALLAARMKAKEEGLKEIHIPPNVGKTLSFLARLVHPRKILEIGTLGGYSALWLARELLPGGKLITLEQDENHARIAKTNFAFAGFEDKIEIRVGRAVDLLKRLIEQQEGPFDLIFLDADKKNYHNYLEPCLALSRSGTLILTDNLIPKRGELGIPEPTDKEALEIYAFNQKLKEHPRLDTVLFPTLVSHEGLVDAFGASIVR